MSEARRGEKFSNVDSKRLKSPLNSANPVLTRRQFARAKSLSRERQCIYVYTAHSRRQADESLRIGGEENQNPGKLIRILRPAGYMDDAARLRGKIFGKSS